MPEVIFRLVIKEDGSEEIAVDANMPFSDVLVTIEIFTVSFLVATGIFNQVDPYGETKAKLAVWHWADCTCTLTRMEEDE